ncbi:MAG: F0F1 ATP synthase subunit B, partial [Pseudohongiellaceae bacterium]
MDITATIFGQMIAFAFFVWFCTAKVWPPLTAALSERQKKIADGLEAASRAEKDLELAQERATDQMK